MRFGHASIVALSCKYLFPNVTNLPVVRHIFASPRSTWPRWTRLPRVSGFSAGRPFIPQILACCPVPPRSALSNVHPLVQQCERGNSFDRGVGGRRRRIRAPEPLAELGYGVGRPGWRGRRVSKVTLLAMKGGGGPCRSGGGPGMVLFPLVAGCSFLLVEYGGGERRGRCPRPGTVAGDTPDPWPTASSCRHFLGRAAGFCPRVPLHPRVENLSSIA